MIDRIIKAGYKNLQLINFFTVGETEVRCWTLRDGNKAPQAGAVIHNDFEKLFICAEIMIYDDYSRFSSESEVKSEGLYRTQGKEYMVLDGDIIHFKIGATQSKKK